MASHEFGSSAKELEGIGGWLYLVIIGLILTVGRLGYAILTDFVPLFRPETWNAITSPASGAYHPLFGPLVIFEVLGNVFFVVFAIVLLVLMFKKYHEFPVYAVGFYALNIFFIVVDFLGALQIPYLTQHQDTSNYTEMARGIIGGCVWIPYFLNSKRVKLTFSKKAT